MSDLILFPFIISRYYGDILRTLYPLFSDSEADDAVCDNAAGAVARMIMVQPQSIPLNQVWVHVTLIWKSNAVEAQSVNVSPGST